MNENERQKLNIIVMACNWCAYQAADLAGSLRYSYPAAIKVIRVPCSGRIETEFILEALFNGIDGVLIGGCHLGDCHYKDGNYKMLKRYEALKRLLPELGIESERLRLEWIGGSEGKKFAEIMNEFYETIKKFGTNPLRR